jgi:hypothetical protein
MDTLLQLTVQQPGGGYVAIGPSSTTLPKGGLTVVEKVIANAFTIFLIIAVLLCAIYIAYAGLQWISSSGDKQKVAQARSRLTWTVVGLIIVMVAIFLVKLVAGFFNVTII